MNFDEAFEKLQNMAGGRRCVLNYSLTSDKAISDQPYPSFYGVIFTDDGEANVSETHTTLESVLVETASRLTGQMDKPEIEG